ncbi:ComF family protein [Flavobacterium azooxidireducens]|uniref:ComF family protein n=1 Tax=Flavobacterium azooxidireducens TaxID=1871076 RepID=A0ABY4KHJ5_9FLAO|nr:ComF family protein [Flavobacterium azooxidireducens]UPQ80289.1 ComF family protein [Flavobacterium azooxidireducens]
MLKSILHLFYPEVCLACKNPLFTNEISVCALCRHRLPLTRHTENPDNEVLRKFYGRLPLEHASALLYFHKKGLVQELIHHLKYKKRQQVGTFLGDWYGEELQKIHSELKFDAIIPVPLHKKRMKERGYNQLTTFGQSLSKSLQIPFYEDILHRNTYSVTQTKKSFLERTEAKKTFFEVEFNESHHNKHYLLIDDVITTGSTLEQCGKAILKIPGTKLSIVCIAYTH